MGESWSDPGTGLAKATEPGGISQDVCQKANLRRTFMESSSWWGEKGEEEEWEKGRERREQSQLLTKGECGFLGKKEAMVNGEGTDPRTPTHERCLWSTMPLNPPISAFIFSCLGVIPISSPEHRTGQIMSGHSLTGPPCVLSLASLPSSDSLRKP